MKIEKKHWKIAIALAVTVSVFAGGGYLVYVRFKKKKADKEAKENIETKELKTETDGKD